MRVGIAGYSGAGKSIIFQWLTGAKSDPAKAQQGQIGKPEIPDDRLDWLSQLFKPKKTTFAKLEFLDTPGLMPNERRDNPRRLAILRDCNSLLVVLNGFSGSDLADELRKFREEILFADLEVVLARIDKLQDQLKKPKPPKLKEIDQAELTVLQKIQGELEKGLGTGILELKEDEEKLVRSFQLLTLKKQLVLVNIGDDRIGQPLPASLLAAAPDALQAPAKLEIELEELSEEDRKIFMEEMKVTGSNRGEVLRKIFYGVGLNVFFTVGEDECRAWPIRAGSSAVESAGEIHTDLSRGFVRGEVVGYADFRRVGSMKEAKTQGVYRLEGKTYIVQDADIMHILAST